MHFSATAAASGETFNFASARFGMFTNYSNCLAVTVSEQGFFMQPFVLMRTGHNPLFIPWQAVSDMRSRRALFSTSTQIAITERDAGGSMNMTLYGKALGESLARLAPHNLQQ